MTITVVLGDDHALIREGLRRSLDRLSDVEVVGEAASAAELRAVVRRTAPNVVVLDIRLSDGNGLDLCRELHAQAAAPAVVILTMYGDMEDQAASAGAAGFVGKDAPARDVAEAIRAAASGRFTIRRRGGGRSTDLLTPREAEVLALLSQGLTVSQISQRLYISDSTTKTHVAKTYAKLGANNRAQALMTAVSLGLVAHPHEPGPPNG